MLAVLSGGGTAGHINPALALGEVLAARGVDLRFAGTPNGKEAELVPAAGISFKPFEAAGFNRNHPTTIVRALRLMRAGTTQCKAWFSEIEPDVVVGFGGYVSIAVGRAASDLGIPLVIHEQNSVMGMTNKYLAKRADAVCLTYGNAAASVADKSKVHLTGNPVRKAVFEATREQGRLAFGIPEQATMLLVTGGSLGARHLNQALAALKDELLAREGLYVVHVTGPKELASAIQLFALSPDEGARWQLVGYTDQMGALMAAADLVVSRAGASSLAEISAKSLPALLVPFPFATEDHQTINARTLVEAGCARMVADADVETPEFRRQLLELVDDAALRARMREAAGALDAAGAACALADIVCACARA